MSLSRTDLAFDVTAALPPGTTDRAVLTTTVVADPHTVPDRPVVILAVPGGTYHRRYWDLQPPGRGGYSKAEYLAARGMVFVAEDYFGGGDSSRPADGDFIGLEVQADVAHDVFRQVQHRIGAGTLMEGLRPLPGAVIVGIGQSLGGFITMIQQAKYADYPGIGIFGASPLLITGVRQQPDWDTMPAEARRTWVMAENARQSGNSELPRYHGSPREQHRGIFHVVDVPDDLFKYDDEHCHTLIPRMSGVDGMTPGFAKPFADRITTPVFLAFGASDVSVDPHREPTGYPASTDITTVVVPNMAHMHNFADTRTQLWDRFVTWLPTVTGPPSHHGAGLTSSEISDPEAVVRELFERLNDERYGTVHEVLAEQCVFEVAYPPAEGSVKGTTVGASEIEAVFTGVVSTMFDGLRFTIEAVYRDDTAGVVVVEYSSTATTRTTARPYQNRYVGVFRVEDGEVALWREYHNPEQMTSAFGSPSGGAVLT